YKNGRAHLNAYLDDHAYLLAALLELMQTSFRAQDLSWAIEIADALLQRFEDSASGGFFFTSHDHEALIHRPKPAHDNATPAGNGIAAQALLTLGLCRAGELPGALARPHQDSDAATAWVCTGTSCLPPIHAPEALERALAAGT